jgi:hypothetical protein
MSKQFLAVGDYLINPQLLSFAILERGHGEPRLRLGFATAGGAADGDGELRLTGDDAREVLRWLRLNATFLTVGGGFGSTGVSWERSIESDSRPSVRPGRSPIDQDWRGIGDREEAEPAPQPAGWRRLSNG